MKQIAKTLPGVLALCLLAACGGGGGGGGSDSGASSSSGGGIAPVACVGSSSPSTPDFTLSTTDLTVTGSAGNPNGTPQTVNMTVGNPAGNTIFITQTVSWLKIVPNLSGGYATVTGNGAALVPGSYCTVVNVALRNASNAVLSSRDVAVKFVVGAPTALTSSPTWNSYNGNVDPFSAGAATLASGASSRFANGGITFVDADGNTVNFVDYLTPTGAGVLRLDSSAAPINRTAARMSNIGSTAYPRYLTFLTRVMPIAGATYDTNNRLWDFEFAFGSSRVAFSLRGDAVNGNVRLAAFEEGGPDINAKLDNIASPHIYQVSVAMTSAYAGTVSVFADANPTPIIGPLSTGNMRHVNIAGDDFVQFGDGRNLAMRGDMDWLVWTTQGAYVPGQLMGKLPTGLGITTGY